MVKLTYTIKHDTNLKKGKHLFYLLYILENFSTRTIFKCTLAKKLLDFINYKFIEERFYNIDVLFRQIDVNTFDISLTVNGTPAEVKYQYDFFIWLFGEDVLDGIEDYPQGHDFFTMHRAEKTKDDYSYHHTLEIDCLILEIPQNAINFFELRYNWRDEQQINWKF